MKDDFKKTVEEFAALVGQFRFEEAIDKYYNENIVAHENEDTPMTGLTKYREATKSFDEDLIGEGSAELLDMIVGEDISALYWHYKFEHRKMGKMDYLQLSVQRWRNGKIIHERHHYKTEKW